MTVDDEPGEIQVRGPGVFRATGIDLLRARSRSKDGWFRTGDMAVRERGYYRIMGRLSVDIIKSGGYKLSALEIEAALLEHPSIAECAVIGLPDDTWGEIVTAVVVLKDATSLELPALRRLVQRPAFGLQNPATTAFSEGTSRNAMGKVSKPAVRTLFSL